MVRLRDEHGHEAAEAQPAVPAGRRRRRISRPRSSGEILFYRELDLPPGRAHDGVDRVRRDRPAGQRAGRDADRSASRPVGARDMSSLVLVSRVEEVSDPPRLPPRTAPLYVGRTLSTRTWASRSGSPSATRAAVLLHALRQRRASGLRAAAAQRPIDRRGAAWSCRRPPAASPARRPAADRRPAVGHVRAPDPRERRPPRAVDGPRSSRVQK